MPGQTERIRGSQEQLRDRLEPERKMQAIVGAIHQDAIALNARTFLSQEEAYAALKDFNADSFEKISDLDDPTSIELNMSGTGVKVPNLGIFNDKIPGNTGAISVVVDRENPLAELPPYETVSGYFNSLTGIVTPTTRDNVFGFEVSLFMVASLSGPQSAAITLEGTSIKLIEIGIAQRAIVELKDTAQIDVKRFEDYKEKKDIAEDLARSGLANSLFRAQLNKLGEALFSANNMEFTELNKLEMLHRLAELGEAQARSGEQKADAVMRAIANTIGRDRLINIAYTKPLSNETVVARGVLEDVLMPTSQEDDQVPSIVFSSKPGPGQHGNDETDTGVTNGQLHVYTHQIELARIHGFSF